MLIWVIVVIPIDRYRKWGKGIKDEEEVLTALDDLDDSYCSLNDLVLDERRGNIDHVVVGHTGVFVLETKNWSGEVVSGSKRRVRAVIR
ncbi:hypothetical protein AKJ46_00195 [candidate division MSBL1 archaeon SCGC-AAA833K04]|uniref:NERD domain-containing protein n=1 Tax=candidate division MSBL1 archaeon SCGC-AAA833K04 TaxID=1698258 RepID=A0A133VSV2_9EURY|nr:hypothetical protein AKJ46_00195 [candidate division MSBL1 archaeon SCGC-AAA833K04]